MIEIKMYKNYSAKMELHIARPRKYEQVDLHQLLEPYWPKKRTYQMQLYSWIYKHRHPLVCHTCILVPLISNDHFHCNDLFWKKLDPVENSPKNKKYK